MSVLPILVFPDKRLRLRARDVPVVDAEARRQLSDLVDTLYSGDGIGLAAPQVGIDRRMIVIDIVNGQSKYDDEFADDYDEFADDYGDELPEDYDDEPAPPDTGGAQLIQLVNPVIVEREGEVRWNEACLSMPAVEEDVQRAERVVVEGLDKDGKETRIEASGMLAVALQHEIDHLDGKLFLDHMAKVKQDAIKKRLQRGGY